MKRLCFLLASVLCMFAVTACIPSPESSDDPDSIEPGPVQQEGTELFCDPNFTAFGPAEALGAEWEKNSQTHLGRITKYRAVSEPLYIIPLGKATEEDGVTAVKESENVHWNFIEGEKYGITDPAGNKVSELLDFRMSVRSQIVENTQNRLLFEQYNDYLHERYPEQYPESSPKLVKRVETDKKGTIKLAYNSYNDISNAAYNFSSQFARNTWPHLYLNQDFHEPVDLAKYEKLTLQVTVKVNRATAVNRWPEGESDRFDQPAVPEGQPRVSVAQVQGYFLLRDKVGTDCWFVGISFYSSNASDRTEVFTYEQHGVPFYRIGLAQDQGEYYDMKGEIIDVGGQTTVSYDLTRQMRYVLDRKMLVDEKFAHGGINPYYGKTLDDYVIAGYHIGWENVGNWDCEAEVSNLSLRGVEKKNEA